MSQSLFDQTLQAFEHLYDADFRLCRYHFNPLEEKDARLYTGHCVCWVSPLYAEALLARKLDVSRAAAILERICDFQQLDPSLPMYGNFFAMAHWTSVLDHNAIAFLSVYLGKIWVEFGDLLPQQTRDRLRKALEAGAVGLVRRRADFFYTNIYLLCIAGKLLFGTILDRPDLLSLAEIEWLAFLDHVMRENISEFNSTTYVAVHVYTLLAIRDYATSETMRRQADAMIELLLTLFAQDYHQPSHVHGGTMARAYRDTLITHAGDTALMANALFDEPLPPDRSQAMETLMANWSLIDYRPSTKVRELFAHKKFPLTMIEKNVAYWGRNASPRIIARHHYQNEAFSLATQYGVWAHYGHCLPFQFTHAGPEQRRSIFFQIEPEYPLIDSWFAQRQGLAIGAFYWEAPSYDLFRAFWLQPPYEGRLACYLGRIDEIELLIDGQPAGGNHQLAIDSTIDIIKQRVGVKIHFPKIAGVRVPEMHLHEQHGDRVIHFTFVKTTSADALLNMSPAVLPVVFQATEKNNSLSSPMNLTTDIDDGVATLKFAGLGADVPVTPQGRARLAAASKPPIVGKIIQSPTIIASSTELRSMLCQ